jgi:hypothetical protein
MEYATTRQTECNAIVSGHSRRCVSHGTAAKERAGNGRTDSRCAFGFAGISILARSVS